MLPVESMLRSVMTVLGAPLVALPVDTGIGAVVSDMLRTIGLPVLALGFLLTMLLRAIQGSTTVALVTATSA